MAYRFKTLAECATFKFKAAAVVDMEQEYEATRNDANGTTGADIATGKAPKIKGVTLTGVADLESHADSDVRYGVGTGTCKVPAAADVRYNVDVDVSDKGLIHVPTATAVLQDTAVDQTTGSLKQRPGVVSKLNAS